MSKLWPNKDVWIIGGGQSLVTEFNIPENIVKDVLKGIQEPSAYSPYMSKIHNEIVIGINAAYMIGDWMDVIFFGDDKIWRNHKEKLIQYPGQVVSCNKLFEKTPNSKVSYIKINKDKKYGISNDTNTLCWNYNSGAAAINLAVNQGAKRIFLVGFDMNDDSGSTHWHNKYEQKRPPFAKHLVGFETISKDARERCIEIVNVSQNSSIKHFPKSTLNNIFAVKEIKKGKAEKGKIKIGVVIPTCSYERKQLLEFVENRISKQTLKPDIILKIDYPNKTNVPDLTKRYKEGFKQLFKQGCDLVFLIEDDDYYPITYIEEMTSNWINKNKPVLIGCSETWYYHLFLKGYRKLTTGNRSSAFCSAVTPKIIYENIKDENPFFDIELWKQNKGVVVELKNKPLGIKHNIGITGGSGHESKIYKKFDNNYKFLKGFVDDEAFKFYNNLITEKLTEPAPLSKDEWDYFYEKYKIKKPRIKIGAVYSTFYDMDMIEHSLQSIRLIADEIVIVHQRIGFNGQKEPQINDEIINRLKNISNIEVIEYENQPIDYVGEGMLHKINIGLESVKKKGCDYIILVSPDENYKASELLEDIQLIEQENIDTMYFPIKAYYYDTKHYFIDTYYRATIYKIDERKFKRCKASVLCDPVSKMEEKKWIISKHYVHHYTFLKEKYMNKLDNSIRAAIPVYKRQMQQISKRLETWKQGQKALVFQNDLNNKGKVILSEIPLKTKEKNKIAVCIPFFKRHEIAEFVFSYYNELKKQLQDEMELILIAVGSEGKKSEEIAKNNGFLYTEFPNNPISQKHNETYLQAKKYEPDACLKIDSDSILTAELFRYYNRLIDMGVDYAGLLDVYFLFKNNLCYFKGYKDKREGETVGVGRFLSKKLLDMLDWKILGNLKLDNLFDNPMEQFVRKHKSNIICTSATCKELNGYSIDIKSDTQLTSLKDFYYDEIFPIEKCGINFSEIKKYVVSYRNSKKFSIVIPTMWKSLYLLSMLDIYENSELISEIIIIDNKPESRKELNNLKIKYYSESKNIFVNKAWNIGALLAREENIIIANDDILITEQDLQKLLTNISIKENEVNGAAESCFVQKGLITGNIRQNEIPKRTWGFGTFLILKKDSYHPIPEQLKIWCGDDYLIAKNKKAKVFKGIEIKTNSSTTIKSENLRKMAEKDLVTYNNLIKN